MPQSQWETLVKEKINICNILIVLVGKKMASASGVSKKIEMKKDQNVPTFGIYVGGANTSNNLPKGLPRNRTMDWCWDDIAAAIEQMMSERKNQ